MIYVANKALEESHRVRASLRREAEIDVKNHGFITTPVALALEAAGVDAAQLERDLLDQQEPSND